MKSLTPDIIAKYKTYLRNSPEVMKEKNKQQYLFFTQIILTLFALSFFLIFAIMPTLQTISNLQKQLADNQLIDESLSAKLDAMSKLSAQYTTIQPNLELINNAVPSSPDISRLTRQIEILIAQHQLILDKLTFGSVEVYPTNKSSSPIYSVSFTVSVTGGEKEIKNMIVDLIGMDRIINLDKVSTGNSETEGGSSTIVGRAFFESKSQ